MDSFVFIVCQHGAEQPLKKKALAGNRWRLAFSRPGLLTLKQVGPEKPVSPEKPGADQPEAERAEVNQAEISQANTDQPDQMGLEKFGSGNLRPGKAPPPLNSPLVRLAGVGLGPVRGEFAEECFEKLWKLAFEPSQSEQPTTATTETKTATKWDAIHVFQRDRALPGAFRFEPGVSELARSVAEALGPWLAQRGVQVPINEVAQPGQRVLDVILSEPNQWFIGFHSVRSVHEQWPGGVPEIVRPAEMISRAYLKIAEALMWSRLPIGSGDAIVEIGSAPGGASQRLLDMGLAVTGVDAAEMDERIAEHPRFEHWRSKAAAVKRKLYRKFKWLVCDANVAPNYTLDIIGDIVNYEGSQIRGLVLTFKLSDWEQLEHLPAQLDEIRNLGFSRVEARQLAHNRRELCVVAQR